MQNQRLKTQQLELMVTQLQQAILHNSQLEDENELLNKQLLSKTMIGSPSSPTYAARKSLDSSDNSLLLVTQRLLNQNEKLDVIVQKQQTKIDQLKYENSLMQKEQTALYGEIAYLKQNQESRIKNLERKLLEMIKQNEKLTKCIKK